MSAIIEAFINLPTRGTTIRYKTTNNYLKKILKISLK